MHSQFLSPSLATALQAPRQCSCPANTVPLHNPFSSPLSCHPVQFNSIQSISTQSLQWMCHGYCTTLALLKGRLSEETCGIPKQFQSKQSTPNYLLCLTSYIRYHAAILCAAQLCSTLYRQADRSFTSRLMQRLASADAPKNSASLPPNQCQTVQRHTGHCTLRDPIPNT